MHFSIITPSFNQIDYLKRCVASVRDQAGDGFRCYDLSFKCGKNLKPKTQNLTHRLNEPISVHHHIQDGGSTDGTAGWVTQYATHQPSTIPKQRADNFPQENSDNEAGRYQLTFSSEPDNGMYDAVSKGWRSAGDAADVVAWLNCDEQYLPGTLAKVAQWFLKNPDKDVLFGEVVIANESGEYICSRKMAMPTKGLIWSDHLPFFTAAMFIRRNALLRHDLFPDAQWKNIGDVELVLRMMAQRVRIGLMHDYLAVFCESGENLGLDESATREYARLRSAAPWGLNRLRRFWVLLHRTRKFILNGYCLKPFTYAVYVDDSGLRRVFDVEKPQARWLSRLS